MDTINPSPLLRLPAEIRLMIWEILFLPNHGHPPTRPPKSTRSLSSTNSSDDHSSLSSSGSPSSSSSPSTSTPWTIHITTHDPSLSPLPGTPLRSTYLTRSTPFHARTMPTTYTLHLPSGPHSWSTTYPFTHSLSLLLTCRTLHAEVVPLLYSSYIFSFSSSVAAIAPFLSDLTPLARAHVRYLAIKKRAQPYCKSSDDAEWRGAMEYLAKGQKNHDLNLERLDLEVQTLHPGTEVWDTFPSVDADWFRAAQGMGVFGGGGGGATGRADGNIGEEVDAQGDGLSWAGQMHRIRGLKSVVVRSVQEKCFVPTSRGMVFWVGFSKSVEKGFRDWCWEEMVERKGEEEEGVGVVDG